LNRSRPLTLIAAPAGFGKTTLLSDWIPQSEQCVTWLSLDEDDNDPIRFWVYVIAALQKLRRDLGESALSLLQSPQPPPIPSILTTLINEISTFPEQFSIVLDDYHLIKTQPIHEALTFLLDHLPPQMHLIITTRADPPLPIPRLRARNHLAELRADDLRFTSHETAVFLNELMGLRLSSENIAVLEARTEGWIAGLQLAALSMHGREDVTGFIQAFSGSHRHVLSYLAEEVLERRPEGTLNFLLQTSILDRLCGPLCDAVTGDIDGQVLIQKLEHANLFIVPLDDEGKWFRYHHLFAEVLRAHLQQTQPSLMVALHGRASVWYEQNGLTTEAVRHALAGQDYDHASHLIEKASKGMWQRGEVKTLQSWLAALPSQTSNSRPQLSLAQAWAALAVGQFTDADSSSTAAEEVLQTWSEVDARSLRAEVTAIRAVLAGYRHENAKSVDLAHQALEHLPAGNGFMRGILTYTLGRAHLSLGDVPAARQKLAEAATLSLNDGDLSTASYALVSLGAELETQGHLHEAAARYRQIIQMVQKNGRPLPFTAAGGACVRLAGIMYEWDQLDEAAKWANQGIELGRIFQNSGALFVGGIVLTRVLTAQGNLAGAFESCRQIETLTRTDKMLHATLTMVEALRARIWLAQSNVTEAAKWATSYEQDLRFPASGDWPDIRQWGRMHDYECLTMIRIRLAQGQWEQVLALLTLLQPVVETGERRSSLLEISVLQALAYQAQSQLPDALTALIRAIILAQPEGFIRTFVDEGEPMRELLSMFQSRRSNDTLGAYTEELLAAFGTPHTPPTSASSRPSLNQNLVEPLSGRELDVLRLIVDGHSNQAIAQKLFLSIGTVKVHIKHIYAKLDVNSRTQAVARVSELDLH
jgi:LuxR family maltose regulon positive regulatory protein